MHYLVDLMFDYDQIRSGWLFQNPHSKQTLEMYAEEFIEEERALFNTQGFIVFSHEPETIVGSIDHLFVRMDKRHQGIGDALVSSVEEELRERGCSLVQLINSVRNKDANFFYGKIRYTIRTQSENYYHFEKRI